MEGTSAGATPVTSAYDITVNPSFLPRDPMTLSFQIPPTLASASLAVYQQSGSGWSRLGGTVEEDKTLYPVNCYQFRQSPNAPNTLE